MHDWWVVIVTIAVFGLILSFFPWLASRVRRGHLGALLLNPIQEMWDPTVYDYQMAVEKRAERKAESPSPDDPPWGDNGFR